MTDYWVSEAAAKLLEQIDKQWPRRDKASDGALGDASHTTGDHVPDPDSDPPNVVRAIDVDAGLDKNEPLAMRQLSNQLRKWAADRYSNNDHRLAYLIYNEQIASVTEDWSWRPYYGSDPHTSHLHVSFTQQGDHRDRRFALPIFRD